VSITKGIDNSSIKKGTILFIMILGVSLAALNQTIMIVAIPELMIDLDVSASIAQWLTTGYMLVNGVMIPVTAFLMQRFTTRELFQSSMLLFLVGTIISAIAANFPVLLTGRLIQAAGAGIMIPLLMNVVFALFPANKRGGVMGTISLPIIFAPAFGPTLAGYILVNYPWKIMFYGMLPLVVVVIVLGYYCLKNVSERVDVKLDMVSVILSTIGFGAMLYGFSRAGTEGWLNIEVLISLIVGMLGLLLFTRRQLTSERPFLDLRAFRNHMFSLTTIINIAITIVMFADMMLLPLYLQNARDFSAMETGLLLLPGTLLMGFLMPITGKLFDRYGAKWLCIIGIIIIIATTLSFVNLTSSTSYIFLMLLSTGRRIGMALIITPIQTAGLNQLPSKLYAHGIAISNTIRQVAGAVGTSLLVTIMVNRTTAHLSEAIAEDKVDTVTQNLMIEASIQGTNDAYFVVLVFALLALLLSFFIKRVHTATNEEREPAMKWVPGKKSQIQE